jgi:hypothetical protein
MVIHLEIYVGNYIDYRIKQVEFKEVIVTYLNKWSYHLIGGTCKFMKTGDLFCD